MQAQNSDTDIIKISARYLCPSYNIDERIFSSTAGYNESPETSLRDNLAPVFDSLQHVEPNAYPLMSQWCRIQRVRASRMANSLEKDYRNDSVSIWIDSVHCLHDGVAFIQQLRIVADSLSALSSHFDQLEKERVEYELEQIAALEKAEAIRQS